MALLGLLTGFAALLFLETALLPHFFGSALPSISPSFLVLGIAVQPLRSGFWFAAMSGLLYEIITPAPSVPATLFAVGIWCAMHAFDALTTWDEPLRRLAMIAVGLLGAPILWLLSSLVGSFVFDVSPHVLITSDIFSRFALREILFVLLWVSVFAWVSVRRFRRRRALELAHL